MLHKPREISSHYRTYMTSGTQKVSGHERFGSKGGKFCKFIPTPMLELKTGRTHRIFREDVYYLNYALTLKFNQFKYSEE